MSSEYFERNSLYLVRLKNNLLMVKIAFEDIYNKFWENELVEI